MTSVAEAAHALRSRTRRVTQSRREELCGVSVVSLYPAIEIAQTEDGPRARAIGIAQCGHIWTCPTCSMKLKAERGARIQRAMLYGDAEWQMVTFTARHTRRDKLKPLLDGLLWALRKMRSHGTLARLWARKVTASVRAIEITWGKKNGWHPHFHVLLRTSEWSDEEKRLLADAWARFVVDRLGEDHRPDDLHGVVWSRSHDGQVAKYVAKLGMEMTGYAKDTRAEGSVVPWDLADSAARLYDRRVQLDAKEARAARLALALWHEYQDATKGRRCIELDDRAQDMAERVARLQAPVSGKVSRVLFSEDGNHVEEVEYEADELRPKAPPLHIDLTPEEVAAWRAGERALPAFTYLLLRALEASEDPVTTLHEWLRFGLRGRAASYRGTMVA